jgi:hypothetical protein
MNLHTAVRTLLFTFLLASSSHFVHASGWVDTAKTGAKYTFGLASVGGALTFGQAMEQHGCLKKISEATNISKEDLTILIQTFCALSAGSLLPFNGNMNAACRRLLFRLPCYALIASLTSSKTFKKTAAKVPVIGKHFGACANEECEGSCNNCKLRNNLLNAAIFYMTFEYLFNYLENPHVEVALGSSGSLTNREAAQSTIGKFLGIVRN